MRIPSTGSRQSVNSGLGQRDAGRSRSRSPVRITAVLRAVLVILLACAGSVTIGVAVNEHRAAAESVAGGKITRSQVIARAKYWYDHRSDITYGGSWYPDSSGKDYRPDCSGYVSMAWHLGSSLDTTSLPSVAVQITKSQLQPGDIMNAARGAGNYTTGHVAIFEKWANADHSAYLAYEFGYTPVQHHVIPWPYFAGDPRTYVPYRYENVVDDTLSGSPDMNSGSSLNVNGNYHVFGIKASNGALYQDTSSNGSWLGWQKFGGTVAGTPGVTYHDGRFDVFALSPGGHAYQRYWVGSGWTGWSELPGNAVFEAGGGLAAVWENGRYHVFGIRPDGTLLQNTFQPGDGWLGWQDLGGTVTGTPAVTYHDGRYDVFALSRGGHMYHKWVLPGSGDGWSSWGEVGSGGVFGDGTGVGATYENGRYHVFGIAPGGALFQNTFQPGDGWLGWQNLGGTVAGTPSVTYDDGRYDVWALTPAGLMVRKWFVTGSGDGWSSWHGVDGGDFS